MDKPEPPHPVKRVERDRRAHDCLEHLDGTGPGGTRYEVEFQALLDDKLDPNVTACGVFSAELQRPLLSFTSPYTPEATGFHRGTGRTIRCKESEDRDLTVFETE